MTRRNAKQPVYRYNGVESSDELVVDLDGEIPTPRTGDIISRKGKNWKVVHSPLKYLMLALYPLYVCS